MHRIGIDARLTYHRQGGIAHYTRQLIRELGAIDTETRYLLLHSRKDSQDLAQLPNQRRVSCLTPSHHPLERWTLAVEILPLRLDLLHNPDFIPPRNGRQRSVITIPDLSFLHYPQFMTAQSRRYYNAQIAAATRRADHIIAISQATKSDTLEMLDVPSDKVSVTLLAADDNFKPQPKNSVDDFLARNRLPADYILFVGTFEPRKNLDGLLRAYAILRGELIDMPPLIIAGRRGWLADNLDAIVEELRLQEHVYWLEEISPADLPLLYSGAAVHCMPSHYEGFGLPALEAMACGTPVVAANRASLPEVVGNAGLLVDPDEPADIAENLERVLSDSSLAEDLRRRGLARASEFNWRETARQTLDVYKRVLARR